MKYLNAIKIQLIIWCVIILFIFLENLKVIPSSSDLELKLIDIFNKGGVLVLFIISFLENIIGINVYFPGSVAILFGMANTHGHPLQAIITFITIVLGSSIAHLINLIIGYSLKNQKSGGKPELKYLFLKLWHPHFAATAAIAIGNFKTPFWYYLIYFLPISLIWNLFWGFSMYFLGGISTSSMSIFNTIFIVYLCIWTLNDLYNEIKKNKSLKNHPT